VLDPGETFTHGDLLAAAQRQGTTIEKHDILIIRTGWIGSFYERDRVEFYKNFVEPGLTYSADLVQWFADMEIPNLVTDTIANEVTSDPESGCVLPLHNALMRNLGVTFTEIAQLDPLATDCANDGQYTFLYAAAPLKVVGGTGAPVNPIVVK
jgi:kynurenine formamidase